MQVLMTIELVCCASGQLVAAGGSTNQEVYQRLVPRFFSAVADLAPGIVGQVGS